MRRRGQALLIVFGVTLAVFLLIAVSYLLVKMYVDNNIMVRQLNSYETTFNSYTAQVDTHIISYSGSLIPTLGSHLVINCTNQSVYFMPVYEDFAHYQTAGADYDKKFAECDVRGIYLNSLAKSISDRLSNLTMSYGSSFITAKLGYVPVKFYDNRILIVVRSDPYFYLYPADPNSPGVSVIFISNGSKFKVLIPNLTTEFDPGVKVCYSFRKREVYLGNCSKPVADYVKLRDEHQLSFDVDARPIYVYDYLAVREALWFNKLSEVFDDNVLMIPVDLSDKAVKSKIWHTDPMIEIIPPKLINKWITLKNLTSNPVFTQEVKVYDSNAVDSEYGKVNSYVWVKPLNVTVSSSSLGNLVGYITYYPSFVRGKNKPQPVIFASTKCNRYDYFNLECAFENVMNYVYVGRGDELANLNLYTPDNFNKKFDSLVSAKSANSNNPFHSIVGAYIESADENMQNKNYTGYFEKLSLGVFYDYPLDANLTTTLASIYDYLSYGTSNELLNPDRYISKSIVGRSLLGLGNPLYITGNGDYVHSIWNDPSYEDNADYTITPREYSLSMAMFFFTLLDDNDANNYGVFSPFDHDTPDDPAGSLTKIRNLRLGNYTLGSVLGREVESKDFDGMWASLPVISNISFRIHDIRSDYYFTLNLSRDVKVLVKSWKINVKNHWRGIENGQCTCYDWSTNTTYNCTDYKNPDYAVGHVLGNVYGAKTSADGSFSYVVADKKIDFQVTSDIENLNMTVRVVNGGYKLVTKNWSKFVLSGFPTDYSSQYVFLKRSNNVYFDLAGCGDPDGESSTTVYAKKVFVGVRQIYDVGAVLSMKVDFNVTGKLYGLDYYVLKRTIMRFLNVSDDNYLLTTGKVFGYWLSGEFYDAKKVGSDIASILYGENKTAVIVPPEVILSSNLHQYVPFTVKIRDFPVMVVYRFTYGYPGKMEGGATVSTPNNSGSLSYNWFDITGVIPTSDIEKGDYDHVRDVAVSYVRNLEYWKYGFPFIESPSPSGGSYIYVNPNTPFVKHYHVRVVGSYSNVKVVFDG